MPESDDNQQIAPTSSTSSGIVNLGFPFSIAELVLTQNERKMTPIWPPVTASSLSKIEMNFFLHSHRHYELIYVLEGTFTEHLENSVFTLNAGDATLLNSRIRHCEGNATECRCLYLNFCPVFLESIGRNTDYKSST